MRDVLGYARYGVQGGDWGGVIGARMALDHPDGIAALHVNILPLRPSIGPDDPPLTDEEFFVGQRWIIRPDARPQWQNVDVECRDPVWVIECHACADDPAPVASLHAVSRVA